MAMSELNLKYPLDEQRSVLLLQMDGICRAQGISYVVVGATARDIMLHYLHGYPIGRASQDIDFAVAVPDWNSFENLRASVIGQDGFSAAQGVAHRFIYRGRGDEEMIPVDLVPFGGVSHKGQIAWPPDMKVVMSVLGFEETLQSALMVRLRKDVAIPVASIPGLVVTKLIAWLDRSALNTKDATDFRALLEAYAQAGNSDRIYADGDLMERHGYDPDFSGAELLGRDVRSIIAAQSLEHLATIFADGRAKDRLFAHMLKGRSTEERQIRWLEIMLDAFASGLQSES